MWGYGGVAGNRVIIYFRDANGSDIAKSTHPSAPTALWEAPEGVVRVQFKYGGFLLRPVSPTVTHVCAIFNFDPMLSVVPYWLLNFVSEKFCLLLIKFMRTAAKSVTDPKSMFARRIRDNPDVYEEIGRRMKLYLGEDHEIVK